jgi:hypothetical protein
MSMGMGTGMDTGMGAFGAVVWLSDWRCQGRYHGRVCGSMLLAYDAAVLTEDRLARVIQVKCRRCGTINGLPATVGRRRAHLDHSWPSLEAGGTRETGETGETRAARETEETGKADARAEGAS